MTIFIPTIENMTGPVPMVCPTCGEESVRTALTSEEKGYLIDATGYHHILEEYHYLEILDEFIRTYPGTRNPLITSKLSKRMHGFDDEVAVAHLIDSTAGFLDFLAHSDFEHFGRFSFVFGFVRCRQERIMDSLVRCNVCPNQYLILPFNYYMSVGEHSSMFARR